MTKISKQTGPGQFGITLTHIRAPLFGSLASSSASHAALSLLDDSLDSLSLSAPDFDDITPAPHESVGGVVRRLKHAPDAHERPRAPPTSWDHL